MNRFLGLLKVFLFIGLRGGQKKMKQKPLCWSLLWRLNYCLFQIFSKLKTFFVCFFKCKNHSWFPLMSWYMQWKATLSKTCWKYSAGNQMRAAIDICETWEMSTLVWQFDLSRHALSFSLTSLNILVIHHMLENNSEVLAWENLISHVWSVSWNTGCSVFLTLLWLGAVRSDLKFHTLAFLHVKSLRSLGFAMESCAI